MYQNFEEKQSFIQKGLNFIKIEVIHFAVVLILFLN